MTAVSSCSFLLFCHLRKDDAVMTSSNNRKVVLIGTGMVGMSYAYALLNQNACD